MNRWMTGIWTLLAAAAWMPTLNAAPAPFPKTPPSADAAPTLARLKQQLHDRGIEVESVTRGQRPGEWTIQVKVRVFSHDRFVTHQIVKRVQTKVPDERAALRALLREGRDGQQMYESDLRQRQAELRIYMERIRLR
jgi:hypothetical protein